MPGNLSKALSVQPRPRTLLWRAEEREKWNPSKNELRADQKQHWEALLEGTLGLERMLLSDQHLHLGSSKYSGIKRPVQLGMDKRKDLHRYPCPNPGLKSASFMLYGKLRDQNHGCYHTCYHTALHTFIAPSLGRWIKMSPQEEIRKTSNEENLIYNHGIKASGSWFWFKFLSLPILSHTLKGGVLCFS